VVGVVQEPTQQYLILLAMAVLDMHQQSQEPLHIMRQAAVAELVPPAEHLAQADLVLVETDPLEIMLAPKELQIQVLVVAAHQTLEIVDATAGQAL
jgi:hypothetical protein